MARVATRSRMRAAALAIVSLGYFMTILDTTVVNVALTTIGRDLGASVTGLQWLVNGYALVFAGLLLTAGTLGDRFGNRTVFVTGLVTFAVASALCSAAPTLGMLQGARVMQGVGAALTVPASLALLRELFTEPSARARAIGVWGGIAGVAASAGPVLGGFLVTTLGWRSIFLVNVPVGILAGVLTLKFVAPVTRLRRHEFDWAGQVSGGLMVGAITFAGIQGGVWGWSSWPILGAFGFAVASAVVLLANERRVACPLLPRDLFTNAAVVVSTVVGFLLNFGFYGQFFLMSLFLQHVRGLSPLATGLALLPETGIVILSSTLAGRLTGLVGPRLPLLLGLSVGGAGLLFLTVIDGATPYRTLAGILLACGFGASFAMPAMTAAMMGAVPDSQAGIASGVLNTSRQVGAVFGVALLGSLVSGGRAFVPGLHVAGLLAGGAYFLGIIGAAVGLPVARRLVVAKRSGPEARETARRVAR